MDNISQAHPPSDAEQLRDARTANGLLRVRLAEQEALVAQYRARAEALDARLGEAMALVEKLSESDSLLTRLMAL